MIGLNILAVNLFPPVTPHIAVSPEKIMHDPLFTLPVLGDFYLINTLVAMLIVDLTLVVMALIARRAMSGGNLVPGGFASALEALLEAIYNLTE